MDVMVAVLWVALGLVLGLAAGWTVGTARGAARVRSAELTAARATARWEAERGHQAEQFKALAAEALTTSSEQFLALAHQRLAAAQQHGEMELDRRQDAVRELVEPLSRTLEAVRQEVSTAERARAEGTAALREQVTAMRESSERLRGETARLVTALRASHVRGRWGELQLRRLVETAGMLPHVDFVEQAQVHTDDGTVRPDMVVNLAGGKKVVVDAKVAFLGFLEAAEADDAGLRSERLAAHARHVRAHVDALAAKRYWEQVAPAPEFVVMFVPAEAFWQAAVEIDPGLVEYAFQRNVVVATPSTLLALLRTVAYGWRQDSLAANAQAVLDLGRELHGRLSTLGTHVARLGRAIDTATTAYNQTVASLETRVLVSARRFAALDVVDGELEPPRAVTSRAAVPSAPELVDDLAP
ncbi:DNA recombination protein RmuC [Actinotalea sp. M2MS4P-6]|uniref:DNA recombination protein RmuC n=1 Tax=Actinotalea sp. M2MS4P-6 TaxID=2983762 RepID=UPI0021E3717A|nr:DNA recombination protein RmuC [Actinotalea sp. M2MS4P-6]MCV2396402.1 DNA recombination protein RmuC [Actinotalea sp. M2MS4P-6]